MLADHPTWPKKKSAPEKEPEEVDGFGGPPQGRRVGIPTPPPLPSPMTTAVHPQCKPCPFCGGPMTVTYVTTASPSAQIKVGCHNSLGCVIAPTVKCDQADTTRVINWWNTRFP